MPPARTDLVAPARSSEAARTKAARNHSTDNNHTSHSLATLSDHLATLTRNTIVFAGGVRIDKLVIPTPSNAGPSSSSAPPSPRSSTPCRQNVRPPE